MIEISEVVAKLEDLMQRREHLRRTYDGCLAPEQRLEWQALARELMTLHAACGLELPTEPTNPSLMAHN